jgi:hypothetical protein
MVKEHLEVCTEGVIQNPLFVGFIIFILNFVSVNDAETVKVYLFS